MSLHVIGVRCEQNHRDCFANKEGVCQILNKTSFIRRCPFYKSAEKYEKDIEAHPYQIYCGKDKESW